MNTQRKPKSVKPGSARQIAEALRAAGIPVSQRTVEGWLQGRPVHSLLRAEVNRVLNEVAL